MRCSPRRSLSQAVLPPRWVQVIGLVCSLSAASACSMGSSDGATREDREPGADAVADAGAPDRGVTADPGAPGAPENAADLAETCFVDEGACTDAPVCQSLRSCCVGDSDCVDTVTPPPLPSLVDWGSCASAATCLESAGAIGYSFGSPGPRITEGALEGGGDGSFDSGVIVGSELDLRHQSVSLTGHFQLPDACVDGCREAIALGVTAQAPGGGTTEAHVPMLAAIVLSGATRTAKLVVRDNAVAQWAVSDDAPMTLQVLPSGRVRALLDGSPVATGDLGSVTSARVVIMGHSRNPLAGRRNAGLNQTRFDVVAADFPDRYSSRGAAELLAPFAEPFDPSRIARPTGVVTHDGRTLVAFIEDEHIFIAEQSETQGDRFGLLTSPQSPSVTNDGPIDSACLLQPLTTGAENPPVYLYFSRGAEGARRVTLNEDGTTGTEELLTVFDGSIGGPLTTDRFRQFHVTQHFQGDFVMVARDQEYGGIQFFRSSDGLAFTALPRLPNTAPLAVPDLGDEVAWPSLSIHNGAWHLFVSVRDGTRFRTHLLLSDDLQRFRHFGPVLTAEGTGFERLGVFAASPILRPVDVRTGTEDGVMTPSADGSFGTQTLEMLYVGDDGTRKRLGRAVRTAPTYGRWQS